MNRSVSCRRLKNDLLSVIFVWHIIKITGVDGRGIWFAVREEIRLPDRSLENTAEAEAGTVLTEKREWGYGKKRSFYIFIQR